MDTVSQIYMYDFIYIFICRKYLLKLYSSNINGKVDLNFPIEMLPKETLSNVSTLNVITNRNKSNFLYIYVYV